MAGQLRTAAQPSHAVSSLLLIKVQRRDGVGNACAERGCCGSQAPGGHQAAAAWQQHVVRDWVLQSKEPFPSCLAPFL